MGELTKATLQKISADEAERELDDAFDVQFNPTSLKLRMSNQNAGGNSRGNQRRQHQGKSSTVLSLELEFDTADEGTTAQPRSVREHTNKLEAFVLPAEDGSETPPKMRFSWKEIIVTGVVSSLDITYDLFASDGTPLRAKASLSITEQDAKYQFLRAGPGARSDESATAPGQGSGAAAPGAGTNGGGGGNSDRSAPALEGETPADFAARMGLDPSAWRGLDVDLGAGLSLEAGVEVGFGAGLSLEAGIGVSAGFSAGVDLSLEAAVGLELSAGLGVGAAAEANLAAGFALSAAGGVTAAAESVNIVRTESAVAAARASFGMAETAGPGIGPAVTTVAGASAPTAGSSTAARALTSSSVSGQVRAVAKPRQSHTPLSVSGPRSYTQQAAVQPAPPPPAADPRAVAYGFGVPLRPRVRTRLEQQAARPCPAGGVTVNGGTGPGFSDDPTVPPWELLPQRDRGRSRADVAVARNRANPCEVMYGGKTRTGRRRS